MPAPLQLAYGCHAVLLALPLPVLSLVGVTGALHLDILHLALLEMLVFAIAMAKSGKDHNDLLKVAGEG